MPTTDINLLSFVGPDFDNQLIQVGEDIVPGPETADTLKFTSQLYNLEGHYGYVKAGYEDVVDINNRSSWVVLFGDTWDISGSKYGFTIKGGSHDCAIHGTIRGHGRECDVDLGNWSDQSNDKTRRIVLNLRSEDGSPIRVRVLNADRPNFEPGSGPYEWVFPSPNIWLHDFFVKSFLAARRAFG
jgi:hypothetical protein